MVASRIIEIGGEKWKGGDGWVFHCWKHTSGLFVNFEANDRIRTPLELAQLRTELKKYEY